MHIGVVYICDENLGNPMSIQLSNFAKNLTDITLSNPLDKIIVFGDFKMPLVTWTIETAKDEISLTPTNIQGSHLLIE